MKILVTGATGLIGSWLVRKLTEDGCEVSVLSRNSSDISCIKEFSPSCCRGDIGDMDSLKSALKGIDAVFHVAGYVKQWKGYQDIIEKVNHIGALNVFNASLSEGVKRVVFVSSALTTGITEKPEILDETSPFNLSHMPYAKSKWLAEKEAIEASRKGLDVVMVNPVTVFGPGDRNLNCGKLIINSAKGKYFVYPPGGTTIVDVRDLANGMILALKKGKKGERYILGNEHVTFREMLTAVSRITGTEKPKVGMPSFLIKISALGMDILSRLSGKEPYPSLPAAELSTKFMYCSSEKASRELGYKPEIAFHESLSDTYNWYLSNGYL